MAGAHTEYQQLVAIFRTLLRSMREEDTHNDFNSLLSNRTSISGIERHGLTPLVWRQVRTQDAWQDTSNLLRNEFKVLAWKNDFMSRQRQRVGREIILSVGQKGITPIALKGFALANSLYDHPKYRPMADIDFLVPKDAKSSVIEVLEDLGFLFDEPPRNRRNIHHHLPIAWRIEQGERISIEFHTDLYSADVRDSLIYEQAQTREITIGDYQVPILSWEQQWLHLLRHQFEPALYPSLKGYMDMALLLHKHANTMDWDKIANTRPMAILSAQRLAFLLDINGPPLKNYRPNAYLRAFDLGIPKLDELKKAPLSRSCNLLFPSRWWLTGRYDKEHCLLQIFHHWSILLRSIIIRLIAPFKK